MPTVTVSAPPLDPSQNYSTGLIAPFPISEQGTAIVPTASAVMACRYYCPRTITVSKIAFCVTTLAGSNDNCDAGIFSSDGATLLASAGTTAGKLNAALGIQSLNMQASFKVVQGTVYYIAFAYGTIGSTAAQLTGTNIGTRVATLMGSTMGLVIIGQQTAAAPPLAAPLNLNGYTNCPYMALLI